MKWIDGLLQKSRIAGLQLILSSLKVELLEQAKKDNEVSDTVGLASAEGIRYAVKMLEVRIKFKYGIDI